MEKSLYSLEPAPMVADVVLLVYAELVVFGILAEGLACYGDVH